MHEIIPNWTVLSRRDRADDLKDVIQHLFEIQSAVHGYLGPETQQELVRKMYAPAPHPQTKTQKEKKKKNRMPRLANDADSDCDGNSKNLTVALSTLSTDTTPNPPDPVAREASSDPSNPPLASIQVPPEIVSYVDAARNPDIYTREFVELVQRGNQDLKGKREAFAGFQAVLAREMRSAMPECAGEVDRVVGKTQ